MGCEMADCPVVARKSEPMKAGDGVEGKTWMSMRISRITCFHLKRGKSEAKGACFVKAVSLV
jgi:hypothetical protein